MSNGGNGGNGILDLREGLSLPGVPPNIPKVDDRTLSSSESLALGVRAGLGGVWGGEPSTVPFCCWVRYCDKW